MSNQQTTSIKRAKAFWIGLALHLTLGAGLYYHVKDKPTQLHGRTEPKVVTVERPAMP